MGGLPLELITMLGSGLMGGVMSMWSQSMKAKQDAFQRAIDGLSGDTAYNRSGGSGGYHCLAKGCDCILARYSGYRRVHGLEPGFLVL